MNRALIAEIDECELGTGRMAFWWLGQMGFVLKMGNTVFYVDLYLKESPERLKKAVLLPGEITNADYVVGTHDHEDHIDRSCWHEISRSSPQAHFVVPRRCVESLSGDLNISRGRFVGMNDDGKTYKKGGVEISAIASAHEFLDRERRSGEYPYLGYIIEANGIRIYHAGDCCIYEGLQSKLKSKSVINVAFLPINGRDGTRYRSKCSGNMTFQEAVDLAGEVNPGLVVPCHYDMFANNLGDVIAFADYMEAKYPGVPFWIGGRGVKVSV